MSDCEPKMVGRLLKKGCVLSKKVRITDFNLAEIREFPVIFSDNPKGTVIHSQLHDKEELDKAVVGYVGIDSELIDPSLQAGIQFPRNFTKDWLKDKNKAKRKHQSIFEDDEDDEEYEEELKQAASPETPVGENQQIDDISGNAGETSAAEAPDAQGNTETQTEGQVPAPGKNQNQTDPEILGELQKNETSVDDSFQIVGNAIKEMGTAAIANHEANMGDQNPSHQAQSVDDGVKPVDGSGEFVQTETMDVEEGVAVEDSAIAEYQKQKLIDEIDVEAIKEEAKARGFEEGFRSGEERATIQYQQKSEELFMKVNELIDEFSNLKTDILDNVQENFFDLSQAMCESLIERSIEMDPEIFANIMRRAISEAVDGDDFKIVVSPKMKSLLEQIDLGELKDNIKTDAKIDDRDFRVESKLGVVDSGIRKIITDLLEEANIQLFDTDKKAG